MEPEELIYLNIEELRGDALGPEETGTKPVRTDAVVGAQNETWSRFKVSTVCLGLLCFLLLTTVIGVGVRYDRHCKQLTTELANRTAEKKQLLVQFQNLTDERDQLQTSFKSAKEELSNLTKSVGTCPHGWRMFGCHCYLFNTAASTWSSSKQTCSYYGAGLVIVNSRGEMMFLNKLGRHFKFWIGLTQLSSHSHWEWTDGTSLQTAYWQRGSPQRIYAKTQRCAAFNSLGDISAWNPTSWTSESCNAYQQSVCEKDTEKSFLS
uniref:CD209 antigen-like protein C n=1 Tax=Semicossyphus pulcher TaxID=241346 RepID=UPI0037E87298